jgi:hypothetical protein
MNMPEKNSATDQTKKKKTKRYVFVQREEDDFTCIKIVEGKFEGVVYKYGKVGFAHTENPDGTLPMKFDYDIMVNPNKVDVDSQEFIDFIGDILMEQLEKQVKDGTAVFDK